MYTRLTSKHKTLTFPQKPRVFKIFAISSRELFVIFKDFSYIFYDLVNSIVSREGKLPQSTQPERYLPVGNNIFLFIYSSSVYTLDCNLNKFSKYAIDIDKTFSRLLYFPQLQKIVMLVQKTHFKAVQLILYFLNKPQKIQKMELNSNFKQPYLLKSTPNCFLIADYYPPNLYIKEMSIVTEEMDMVQTIYNNILLDVSTVNGCFFSDFALEIFAMKKNKALFIKYDYYSNCLQQQITILKDNVLIYSIYGGMQGHYALNYIQVENKSNYFGIISHQGVVIDKIKVKEISLQNTALSLDGNSLFEFFPSNQKWIQKVKMQNPTIIKFNQIKAISKNKIYFRILKQNYKFGGEGLWRRVLNIIG